MKVILSAWHESETCLWCEKTRDCVAVEFGDNFISKGNLCWSCLQTSVKVHQRSRAESQRPSRQLRKSPERQTGDAAE